MLSHVLGLLKGNCIMLNSVNYTNSNPKFGHGNSYSDSKYNKQEKRLIAATTAIGVLGSLAYLSKSAGYSLKPQKMFKNIKNSYLVKAPYDDEKAIITIGAGSCIGGLTGGFLVDKNKQNRKAKLQETLLQIANISIPAFFTVRFAKGGKYLGKKFLEKNPLKQTYRTTIAKSSAAMVGLMTGVYCSNLLANKVNEIIFKQADFTAVFVKKDLIKERNYFHMQQNSKNMRYFKCFS